jgi:prepilin-type N-terminal cleavage/methylation domain-containing protein
LPVPSTRTRGWCGYSLVELLFVLALIATLSTVTVPGVIAGLDDHRAAAAARYVSARFQRARMEAVVRSRAVAVRFTRASSGRYVFTVYVDGNRNGVTAADIGRGVDRGIAPAESIADTFPGIEFGVLPGLPPVESGSTPPGNDPIRLGTSDSATFSAAGTSSSGSVYLRGRRTQYVVRLFGETGKTRVLQFDARTRQWKPL